MVFVYPGEYIIQLTRWISISCGGLSELTSLIEKN